MTETTETMAKPTTWQSACREALEHILDGLLEPPQGDEAEAWAKTMTTERIEQMMRRRLDRAIEAVHPEEIADRLGELAMWAWAYMYVDGYALPSLDWMVQKLAAKQRAYGCGNILRFGMEGLKVRASDKVERVSNMRAKGLTDEDESLFDSLFDLVGYATIARMLADGTFELPLANEPEPEPEPEPRPWLDLAAWQDRGREDG